MQSQTTPLFAVIVPAAFVAMWLAVTTVLSLLSGWRTLMRRYPDRDEPALLTLRWQSGEMGYKVSLRGVLTLSACPSGLRVASWKIFAPFDKPFFVPWNEIATRSWSTYLAEMVELTFGAPAAGTLTIPAVAWSRLSAPVAGAPGAPVQPSVSDRTLIRNLLLQWATQAAFAGAVFTLIPRLAAPAAAAPPLALTLGLPAVAVGLFQALRYYTLRRKD